MTQATIFLDRTCGKSLSMSITAGDLGFVALSLDTRKARALANRLLHECDHIDGQRDRRPSEPHLRVDLLPLWERERTAQLEAEK